MRQNKIKAILFVIALVAVFISGCSSNEEQVVVPVKNLTAAPKINCSDFNANPQLWYKKSKTDPTYYLYYPVKELQNEDYILAEELIKSEKLLGDDKNKILAKYAKPCVFGKTKGQNVNYLYCPSFSFSAKKIDKEGRIISTKFLKIETTMTVDKTIERSSTTGVSFSSVQDSEVVTQKCSIVSSSK